MLAQFDVSHAHIRQGLQLPPDPGDVLEEFQGLVNGHIQNIPDALPFVLHLQGFPVVPFPPADFTGHINVGQKVHFNFDDAIAAAGFAAPALDVKAIPARPVSARP